jgi:hypothetical protein
MQGSELHLRPGTGIPSPIRRGESSRGLDTELYGETNEKDSSDRVPSECGKLSSGVCTSFRRSAGHLSRAVRRRETVKDQLIRYGMAIHTRYLLFRPWKQAECYVADGPLLKPPALPGLRG